MAKNAPIEFNSYQNEIFSAFWPSPFYYKGHLWKCIEQFYQYRKLHKKSDELRQKIVKAYDPYKMKYFGSSKAGGVAKEGHDAGRLKIMEIGIREAYMQNPHRLMALQATGKTRLSHKMDGDEFWGTGRNGKGADQMGVLLTKFRDSVAGLDPWKACKNHKISMER